MESKDIQTSDSLQTEECEFHFFLQFVKEQKQPEEILANLLENWDEEEGRSMSKMKKVQNLYEERLQHFDSVQKQHFEKYRVFSTLKLYVQTLSQTQLQIACQDKVSQLLNLKKTYIQHLQQQIHSMITQVNRYRTQIKLLLNRNHREEKMNVLLLKVYNLRNYIEQLQLISNLTNRVKNNVQNDSPDMRSLQQLTCKTTVPYDFYHRYCLDNCCRVVQKRIESHQMVRLIHSQTNYQLLQHFLSFFYENRSIDEQCSLLILMTRHVRITNKDSLPIENGLLMYFKPFFIDSLTKIAEVETVIFLKARSMMQNQEQTIDIWREYEDIKVQEYCIWLQEHMRCLKTSQTVHLYQVKALLKTYRKKYSWVEHLKHNNTKIPHKHTFPTAYLKIAIVKILRPFLLHLFFKSIPSQSLFTKHRVQYKQYFLYYLFRNYRMLFDFIKESVSQVIDSLDKKQKSIFFDRYQLNAEQYYSYYQQLSQMIEGELGQKILAGQFQQFWKEFAAKIQESLVRKEQLDFWVDLDVEYENRLFYRREEEKLVNLLQNKKKGDSFKEDVYTSVMKLHFNTSNYFLLQEAIKTYGKGLDKQIGKIREVAYNQFYT